MTWSLPTQEPCLPTSPPLKTSPMHSPQPSPQSPANPTMHHSRTSKTNSKPMPLQFPLPWVVATWLPQFDSLPLRLCDHHHNTLPRTELSRPTNHHPCQNQCHKHQHHHSLPHQRSLTMARMQEHHHHPQKPTSFSNQQHLHPCPQ